MKLVIPTTEYIPSYAEALAEGHHCGADKVKTPEQIAAITADPAKFIAELNGPKPATRINEKGEEVERVPDTKLWLVSGDTFVGDVNIRHRLNPTLEASGGHIGYGIRPSWQGKGAATELLRLCLIWCREELKLDKVLLSCRVENAASSRVIEKNGGELMDVTQHPYAEPGVMQKRYWVKTR